MARGLGTPSRVPGVETLVTPGLRELRQQVLGGVRPWDEGPEDPHRGPAPPSAPDSLEAKERGAGQPGQVPSRARTLGCRTRRAAMALA